MSILDSISNTFNDLGTVGKNATLIATANYLAGEGGYQPSAKKVVREDVIAPTPTTTVPSVVANPQSIGFSSKLGQVGNFVKSPQGRIAMLAVGGLVVGIIGFKFFKKKK